MANFEFPFYDQPETEKAKVTTIVCHEPTPEELEEAFEELYFGGAK